MNRRDALVALTSGLLMPSIRSHANANSKNLASPPHIATNTYPWSTFARREKTPYNRHTDSLLQKIASTGLQGYEPIIGSPSEFNGLAAKLKNHGLKMRSIYVNSSLHESSQSERSIEAVLEICSNLEPFGTQIIVTNPSPIRWGGSENKSDDQLKHQAKALDSLGARLRNLGLTLA